jgi:DNA adenine methylase
MAPWIIERLPEHDHFIEACAGSAAILAAKPRVAAETVNDVYGEVVNFFRVLRDPEDAERLIGMLAFTPYSLAEFRHALTLDAIEPVTRAWAFFVRM